MPARTAGPPLQPHQTHPDEPVPHLERYERTGGSQDLRRGTTFRWRGPTPWGRSIGPPSYGGIALSGQSFPRTPDHCRPREPRGLRDRAIARLRRRLGTNPEDAPPRRPLARLEPDHRRRRGGDPGRHRGSIGLRGRRGPASDATPHPPGRPAHELHRCPRPGPLVGHPRQPPPLQPRPPRRADDRGLDDGHDGPPDRCPEPAGPARPARRGARPRRPLRPPALDHPRRHRPFQAPQRHPRPRRRRPDAPPSPRSCGPASAASTSWAATAARSSWPSCPRRTWTPPQALPRSSADSSRCAASPSRDGSRERDPVGRCRRRLRRAPRPGHPRPRRRQRPVQRQGPRPRPGLRLPRDRGRRAHQAARPSPRAPGNRRSRWAGRRWAPRRIRYRGAGRTGRLDGQAIVDDRQRGRRARPRASA